MGEQTFVFTWASTHGPEKYHCRNAEGLLSYAAGWTGNAAEHGEETPLLIVRHPGGSFEVRA